MNILFLTDNFPPEVNAPATRTYEHCRAWVAQGARVTVVTCAPNFPQGKVYAGYRNRWRQEEMMDGIRVIRVWSYISANKGFFRRTMDYLSFAGTAWWASLWEKADVVVATSPQFFVAVSGWFSGLCKQKPWVMEVRDLWPESIRAVEAVRSERLIRWLEKWELFLYDKAAAVVVVTDSSHQNLTARGVRPEKVHVVKNGVHLAAFQQQTRDAELVEQLGLQGKFVVGYLGTHGMAHRLEFILQCARHCPEDIHFLFIGDGAEKESLLRLQRALQLQNVTFLPPVPKEYIARYIGLADVALAPLKKSDTFKTVIPSKIFESAAMQKPILLGVEGESRAIVESYGAGLCFEPENEADFLEKLFRLKADTALYRRCQEACLRLARDFDRGQLAHALLQILHTAARQTNEPCAE